MRSETVAILGMIDALPNFSRAEFFADIEHLVTPSKFYTQKEVAERYGVTVQTLINWEKQGRLSPDMRAGAGFIRYSETCLNNFEKQAGNKVD